MQLNTAIVMSLALTLVVAFSNLAISRMRRIIPRNIRIIAEVAVIATLVIIADELLKAFMYDISKQLSVFVGLIITNCIVLGRAEGFALSNPPFRSFMDGIANGIGYSSILIGVAFFRELLGSGKLFGFQVVPNAMYDLGYVNNGLMVLAPGAFIIIGLFVWLEHTVLQRKSISRGVDAPIGQRIPSQTIVIQTAARLRIAAVMRNGKPRNGKPDQHCAQFDFRRQHPVGLFFGDVLFFGDLQKHENRCRTGIAVIFVLTITTPANWLVYNFLLAPGALAWAGFPELM